MFTQYTETNLYLKTQTEQNCIAIFPDAELVGTIESSAHELDVLASRGICQQTGKPFLAVSIGKFRSFDLNEPMHFFKVLGEKTDNGEVKYSGYFEIPSRPMDGHEVQKPSAVFRYSLIAVEHNDLFGNVQSIGGSALPVQH